MIISRNPSDLNDHILFFKSMYKTLKTKLHPQNFPEVVKFNIELFGYSSEEVDRIYAIIEEEVRGENHES